MNSNDLANVMGSFIETELNSFEELNKELEEKDKEIERLNKARETDIKYNKHLQSELAKANNIIKEVREYIMSNLISEWNIKNGGYVSGSDLPVDSIIPILEILNGDSNVS